MSKAVAQLLIQLAVASINGYLAYIQKVKQVAGLTDEEAFAMIDEEDAKQLELRKATLDAIAQKRAEQA